MEQIKCTKRPPPANTPPPAYHCLSPVIGNSTALLVLPVFMRECITIVGIYIKHLCLPNVTNIINHLIITVLLKLSSVYNLDTKIAKHEHRFIGYDDLKIKIKIVFKA